MSENAVLAALRRVGYTKKEMTSHGFLRGNAAYNFAEHLPERCKMMQA